MGFRRIAVAIMLLGTLIGPLTAAGHADSPVVVELYTSQGCSSCPPADELLTEIADREDVIALALHVDYWDYLGWQDAFANPAYTQRQRNYARAAGKRMIYTPQMVIGGLDHIVGHKPRDLRAALREHAAKRSPVNLALSRRGNDVEITAQAAQGTGPMVVQLVRYAPEQSVSIRRGENAGRDILYSNIVTSWQNLAEWNGRNALSLRTEAPGEQPIVVIVQSEGYGAILAAERLR